MALFRVLKRLDTGHVPGDIVEGGLFKRADLLVGANALARVKGPPLTELPGWQARAEKLRRVGIETVEDLLDMDPRRGTRLFRHKRESTFIKWVKEARYWLLAPPRPKSG